MPAKILFDTHGDDIVKLYQSGLSVNAVAERLGVDGKSVRSVLKKKRISIRGRPLSDIKKLEQTRQRFAEIQSLYLSGIGVAGVANRLGLIRTQVELVLRENGVPLRNASEQQYARMNRASPAERKALAKAANEASRGRKASFEELCRRAKSLENTSQRISWIERKFFLLARNRGLVLQQQTAVGPYNCDFTFGSVAVEIWGGHWHFTGDHAARTEERFRYILNAGFSIVTQVINETRPLTSAVADNLITRINALSLNPPSPRRYEVIWGDGEFSTGGSLDDDKITFKPSFTYARDVATGRYKTVAR